MCLNLYGVISDLQGVDLELGRSPHGGGFGLRRTGVTTTSFLTHKEEDPEIFSEMATRCCGGWVRNAQGRHSGGGGSRGWGRKSKSSVSTQQPMRLEAEAQRSF